MGGGGGGAGGRPTIRRSVRAAAADDRDTSWIERLAPQRWVEAREAKEHEAALEKMRRAERRAAARDNTRDSLLLRDDGSDDEDDDDDDDDVLEADRRLRASMPQRHASTSPRRLFSFARLRRLFVGADDNGIKRTMSAPGGRNLVDF